MTNACLPVLPPRPSTPASGGALWADRSEKTDAGVEHLLSWVTPVALALCLIHSEPGYGYSPSSTIAQERCP